MAAAENLYLWGEGGNILPESEDCQMLIHPMVISLARNRII